MEFKISGNSMNVNGKHYRTIWLSETNDRVVQIIDQRHLPHRFVIENICTLHEMAIAISDMHVRGAGLIGAAAGFEMYLSALEAQSQPDFEKLMAKSAQKLKGTRPTAVNQAWAVEKQLEVMKAWQSPKEKTEIVRETAKMIADFDADCCHRIGLHGLPLIEEISRKKGGKTVNILTHCNAGWLAFVDYGTATAPIYEAFKKGINLHVWVDETRPRNQGASLTAWELGMQGVPQTVITDNAGGHLMQHGMVDLVMVGSDRTTHSGDVANKIGTYLKALVAITYLFSWHCLPPLSTGN